MTARKYWTSSAICWTKFERLNYKLIPLTLYFLDDYDKNDNHNNYKCNCLYDYYDDKPGKGLRTKTLIRNGVRKWGF